MAVIIEVVIAFLAMLVYGAEERPRHPFWRNSVRTIAFSGTCVAVASLMGWLDDIKIPLIITSIWAICSLIVISAEYYVGSKKIGWAAIFACLILFAVAIATSF